MQRLSFSPLVPSVTPLASYTDAPLPLVIPSLGAVRNLSTSTTQPSQRSLKNREATFKTPSNKKTAETPDCHLDKLLSIKGVNSIFFAVMYRLVEASQQESVVCEAQKIISLIERPAEFDGSLLVSLEKLPSDVRSAVINSLLPVFTHINSGVRITEFLKIIVTIKESELFYIIEPIKPIVLEMHFGKGRSIENPMQSLENLVKLYVENTSLIPTLFPLVLNAVRSEHFNEVHFLLKALVDFPPSEREEAIKMMFEFQEFFPAEQSAILNFLRGIHDKQEFLKDAKLFSTGIDSSLCHLSNYEELLNIKNERNDFVCKIIAHIPKLKSITLFSGLIKNLGEIPAAKRQLFFDTFNTWLNLRNVHQSLAFSSLLVQIEKLGYYDEYFLYFISHNKTQGLFFLESIVNFPQAGTPAEDELKRMQLITSIQFFMLKTNLKERIRFFNYLKAYPICLKLYLKNFEQIKDWPSVNFPEIILSLFEIVSKFTSEEEAEGFFEGVDFVIQLCRDTFPIEEQYTQWMTKILSLINENSKKYLIMWKFPEIIYNWPNRYKIFAIALCLEILKNYNSEIDRNRILSLITNTISLLNKMHPINKSQDASDSVYKKVLVEMLILIQINPEKSIDFVNRYVQQNRSDLSIAMIVHNLYQ